MLLEVGGKGTGEVLPSIVHAKSAKALPSLALPSGMGDPECVKSLISTSQQMQVEGVTAVIHKADEVQFAVRSANGKRATDVAVDKIKKMGGPGGGGRMGSSGMLAFDAGLAHTEGSTLKRDAAGGLGQSTNGRFPNVTQARVPKISGYRYLGVGRALWGNKLQWEQCERPSEGTGERESNARPTDRRFDTASGAWRQSRSQRRTGPD